MLLCLLLPELSVSGRDVFSPIFEKLSLDLRVYTKLFIVTLDQEVGELLDFLGRSVGRTQRLFKLVL